MTSTHGRVNTLDQNGNPVLFPFMMGDNVVRGYFGHAESGNTAAAITLDGRQHTFRTLSLGHIYSLSPQTPDGEIYIEVAKPGAPVDQVETFLLSSQQVQGLHVPGGTLVTINATSGTVLIDERVGTREVGTKYGLSRNVPEVTDLIHRTPLIAHADPTTQYLLPGEFIPEKASPCEDPRFDYTLHKVSSPDMREGDRVFLAISGLGDDVCYVGNNAMYIEVLSGSGTVLTANLEHGDATMWDEEKFLTTGEDYLVPPDTRVQFEAGNAPFILRDTTPGFQPHHEIPTDQYHLRNVGHGPVKPSPLTRA